MKFAAIILHIINNNTIYCKIIRKQVSLLLITNMVELYKVVSKIQNTKQITLGIAYYECNYMKFVQAKNTVFK